MTESTHRILAARDRDDSSMGIALLVATDPWGETFCVCRGLMLLGVSWRKLKRYSERHEGHAA